MKIYGMIKTSTVDYPAKIVTTVFLGGCNFNCEYCQNFDLIKPAKDAETISEETVIAFLKKRKGIIDGLCISGGEPTIHDENLIKFIRKVKSELGNEFLIKLDTNGSNPGFIKKITEIVDYVALDLKALDYSKFSNISLETVLQSLNEIKKYIKDYEVRITMYPAYILESDFEKIAEILKDVPRISLQQYKPMYKGVNLIYPNEFLESFAELLSCNGTKITVR